MGEGDNATPPTSPSAAEASPPSFQIERPVPENYFVLEIIQCHSFKQSNAAKEITYKARLKNPSDEISMIDLSTHIPALFESILDEARRGYGEAGVMRIFINHSGLEKPIIITPTYLGELTSKIIIDYIDRCLYSAGVIPADELWEINAAIVHLLNGKGRKPLTNLERDIKGKRSLVKIVNNDNTCFTRAIMVGFRRCLAFENKDNKVLTQQYNRIRDFTGKLQGIEARIW